jgi:hypothetical protein
MTPKLQSILALLVVALAVGGLAFRFVSRRGKPGCGGDCGCASGKLKPGRGKPGV